MSASSNKNKASGNESSDPGREKKEYRSITFWQLVITAIGAVISIVVTLIGFIQYNSDKTSENLHIRINDVQSRISDLQDNIRTSNEQIESDFDMISEEVGELKNEIGDLKVQVAKIEQVLDVAEGNFVSALVGIIAPSRVIQGELVNVSITISALGTTNDRVNVQITLVSNNGTLGNIEDDLIIGETSIALLPGESYTETFVWDTTDVRFGSHLLSAHNHSERDTISLAQTNVTVLPPNQ